MSIYYLFLKNDIKINKKSGKITESALFYKEKIGFLKIATFCLIFT